MKNTRKISIVLVLVMVLMLAVAIIPASAAGQQPATLYLTPNANWKIDNARFAAYFFGNGETWVSMTDSNGDGVYEVAVPTDKVYPKVIFCRMNPNAAANNWNNKWNQTADLTIPTNGTDLYTVKEGTWDKGGGTWTTFNSTCEHVGGEAATCTKAQLCTICGEEVASALGHTYNTQHLCTRCNEQATFTVAGSGAHLGVEWDTTHAANDMTYDAETGTYTKVYEGVAAGSYKFKVARDHDWGTAYPASDKSYTVKTAGSKVTITLKGTTVNVVVEDPHTHSWSNATCTEPQKCECGETQGDALGHSYMYPCDAHCMVCYELTNEDASHSVEHVDAVDSTCQTIGNIEYWYCTECGLAWIDAGCTQLTNLKSVKLPTVDHKYNLDGKCAWCDSTTNFFEFCGSSIRYKDADGNSEPFTTVDIRVGYQLSEFVTAWGWNYQLGGNSIAQKNGVYKTEDNISNIVFADVIQGNFEKSIKVQLWVTVTIDGESRTIVEEGWHNIVTYNVVKAISEKTEPEFAGAAAYAKEVLKLYVPKNPEQATAVSNDEE